MSTSKDPGAQPNPGREPAHNGDAHAAHRNGVPLPVKLDAGQQDGHAPDGNGLSASNGVNGAHHTPESPEVDGSSDPPATVEAASQDGAADLQAADATAADSHSMDSTGTDSTDTVSTDTASTDTVAASTETVATEEVAALTEGLSTLRSAVKIKGRPGGVALELGEGVWEELILLLEERLKAAEGFFRGGRVLLDVGARALVEEQLRQVQQVLEQHEMFLAVVRSTAERTLQAAAEIEVATTIEEFQEPPPEPPLIVPDGPPNAYTPSPYAPPPETVGARPNHFVHRGSLRSGQVLRKTESIVIIGDVNPGAQVISGGDIMVWGRLRGIAHAGAEGNRRAVVAAIDFVPTQLRIANLTAIAPEQKKASRSGFFFWKKEPERRPEIARVTDGRIVVEPWDEGKPSGLSAWRK